MRRRGASCATECHATCVPDRRAATRTASSCPPLSCDALFTEEACAARSECRAVFRGQDCTCTQVSCSCAVRQFERCEAVADGT
ncbi:MAG TPA: hypothetical protein VF469_35155 [Kofleriaceae bacterium]